MPGIAVFALKDVKVLYGEDLTETSNSPDYITVIDYTAPGDSKIFVLGCKYEFEGYNTAGDGGLLINLSEGATTRAEEDVDITATTYTLYKGLFDMAEATYYWYGHLFKNLILKYVESYVTGSTTYTKNKKFWVYYLLLE